MQKKDSKKNSFLNSKNIFLVLILLTTIIMSIGYATVNSVSLELSGASNIKTSPDIYIYDAQIVSGTHGANTYESSINMLYKSIMKSQIVLGNDADSTVTLNITMYNTTTDNMVFTGITYSENFYSNDKITYDFNGLSVGTRLDANSNISFTMTFRYTSSDISNNVLNSYIKFNFEKYYTITYVNINTTNQNYPTYILDSESTKTITFSNDVPYDVQITPSVSYTYSSPTLTLNNVKNNITIDRYYSIAYVTDGVNPANQPTKYLHGSTVTFLEPTYANHTFAGWYRNSSYTGSPITTTSGINENLTLYAKWNSTTYATDYIIALTNGASSSSKDIINVSSSSSTCTNSFAYDGTTDNNLRYIGANPCNYLTFASKTWRIIGVFNNIEISGQSGTHTLLKVMLDENYVNGKWDTGNKNIWQNSSLYSDLNNTFYPNTINSDSRIVNAIWNLGTGTSAYATNAPTYYTYERSNTPVSNGTATTAGYVGLLYPSDFGFATSGVSDLTLSGASQDRMTCVNSSLSSGDWDRDTDPCVENDWLIYADYMWTIMPRYNYTNNVWRMRDYGGIQYVTSNGYNCKARPVVYLASDVQFRSGVGDGSSSSPYELVSN